MPSPGPGKEEAPTMTQALGLTNWQLCRKKKAGGVSTSSQAQASSKEG